MTPAVTVAIVSWNTRDLLDGCLRSLRADAEAGLVDVWVHDNASTDGSPEMVAERHPWAHLVRGENIGYGPAVNRIAERTQGEWIAASNADIRVAPGAIETMLEAGRRDPQAAIVAPRLVLPDGSTQKAAGAFQTARRQLLSLLALDRLGPRSVRVRVHPYLDMDTPRRVESYAGAFLLIRREPFDAVGRFDEAQWMYAEDVDLCWRLREAGRPTYYEPAAVVHHEHSAAADAAFGDTVAQRQHEASWEWSVRRLGRAQTALVGAMAMAQGGVTLLAALALRHGSAEGARDAWRWGLMGLRAATRARP